MGAVRGSSVSPEVESVCVRFGSHMVIVAAAVAVVATAAAACADFYQYFGDFVVPGLWVPAKSRTALLGQCFEIVYVKDP